MKYSEIQSIATHRLKNDLFDNIGYKLRKGGYGGGFGFYKSYELKIISIGCGINIYGDFSVLRHFSSRIMFKEIEELFAPIVSKNGLMGVTKPEERTTISSIKIPGFENRDYSRYSEDIRIEDEKGINILVERFKDYYYEIAAPAFESFTSIEQFVPLIKDMDIVALSDYFGMGAIFKKAIIYKLCNVEEYDTFITERILAFEKVISNGQYDIDTPKWYNTALELKDILDKTPPKYNM